MLEYRIVEQIGEGKPFSLWNFKSYEACYIKLVELIQNCRFNVNREYYVINEFFENEYPPFLPNIKKFTIEVREVDNWIVYDKNTI